MSDTAPIPAAALAGLRVLIGAGVSFGIGKGWIDPSNVEGVTSIAIAVATVGWGIYKTHNRQKKLVG